MRSSFIASALVACSALAISAATVPQISVLSCDVGGIKTNSSRVIKKPRKKGHKQLPLSSGHSHSKNRTISSNSTSKSSGHLTSGLIQVVDKKCGPNGATLKSTKTSGPNGAIQWLNCGISKSDPDSGWTPPSIQMSDLIYKDLADFTSSTFKPCAPYLDIFNEVAKDIKIPPIFIAAFAMEESSCNPDASGDNGDAYGLMQITSDKCDGAPDGNCADPKFNIRVGAEYFASQLKAFNGDVPLAIGQYNGWTAGMSYNSATAAANSGCCDCQNNLDYLHQFFNGWIQGIDGYNLAFYNNLAVCGD